jgi:hypothetical protein
MARKLKTPKVPRSRKRSLSFDSDDLANHIADSLTRDIDDRSEWMEMRLQRYAKARGWREPKSFPWNNASNAHLPFLLTEVLRTQDTIHNAVLARHPVVEAMAVQPVNMQKQKGIDNLLDYQLFVEQPGEEIVATLAQQYVEDGVFMAYVPWIRYDEAVNDIHILEPLPDNVSVADGVRAGFQLLFTVIEMEQLDTDGFRWKSTILDGEVEREVLIDAYIEEEGGRLELSLQRHVRAYDGPRVIPKSVDEWGLPWRSGNVQPPSPSNPNGAEHVWLLDYPTLDEIRRLKSQGDYDLLTDEDLEKLEAAVREDPEEGDENNELKEIKDEFEGVHGGQGRTRPEDVSGAGKLTRVLIFLGWDVNDDGLEEQIVVSMIRETKTILRVRYLTEAYPSDPPLRPLASAGFLPVENRVYAISLLELLESIHDLQKMTFDQMFDSATITNLPWGAYRPQSGINPETLHISPGEMVPLSSPREDLFFPQFGGQAESFGLNMISLLSQFAEKASLQGDLQFGRVPKGKASALRTATATQNILAQGDARPERIMRRFFSGFKDVYRIMHELNQRMLPKGKQYRLMEPDLNGTNVYADVADIEMISGRMEFIFKAGMFNTDKQASQEALQELMSVLINPMTLQLQVVGPEQIHNLLTDVIKLKQREPARYLAAPQQGPPTMKITAEEAVSLIVVGRKPTGTSPAEGAQAHLQKLQGFMQRPEVDELDKFIQGILQSYMLEIQALVQQEQQQQQLGWSTRPTRPRWDAEHRSEWECASGAE